MPKAVNEKNLGEWKGDPKSRGRARYNAASFAEYLGVSAEDVEASEVWKAHLSTRKPGTAKKGTRRAAGPVVSGLSAADRNLLTRWYQLSAEDRERLDAEITTLAEGAAAEREYLAAQEKLESLRAKLEAAGRKIPKAPKKGAA
jgi:DNA-binding transcriptional MerR regulator